MPYEGFHDFYGNKRAQKYLRSQILRSAQGRKNTTMHKQTEKGDIIEKAQDDNRQKYRQKKRQTK